MSFKDDVKDVSKEVKEIKVKSSFALELLSDLKAQNKRLFIANVLLALALIISLLIILIGGK